MSKGHRYQLEGALTGQIWDNLSHKTNNCNNGLPTEQKGILESVLM